MRLAYLRFCDLSKHDLNDTDEVYLLVRGALDSCLYEETARPSSFSAKHKIEKRPRYIQKTLESLTRLSRYPFLR